MDKDKLIEDMLKDMGDKNNTIDLNAYGRGLIDMYDKLFKNCSMPAVSGSATRTIRTQQGFSQHELTLPEDDAVIYMLLLKRNGIWFADVTK